MVKIKALKSFISALGNYEEGQSYEVDHDKYTINNWVENGLIEPVLVKKSVNAENENQ